ncbi:MAG: HNH endonuclease [Nitrospirae bacterium]|nr:MAG: HNH endonuclease [Nitrospirota bacterium]
MPCSPARARILLRSHKAAVLRRYPFTIILKDRAEGDTQSVELKVDPGSKVTGIALAADYAKRGKTVVFAAEVQHRGQAVKDALDSRRAIRRGRRTRKTRYRAPRFDNRTREIGWLPPSLMSRVFNVTTWALRLQRFAPLSGIAVETVRFDTQLMVNPDISGVEYQQGTLAGYELREYLLQKWSRTCAYCKKRDIPLQVEHIVPRSRGGSDRVSNLTLACEPCNLKKGNMTAAEFGFQNIQRQAQSPLKDAAAVNATRYMIGDMLRILGLPIEFWSGGRTKFNRVQQGYAKAHWIDAACVGESGVSVSLNPDSQVLQVKAAGQGTRQMCRMDKFGFPRTSAKTERVVKGFRTGDIVRAIVPSGKKAGLHCGKVAVRSSGSFNVSTLAGVIQGISYKYCSVLHRADGYSYLKGEAIPLGNKLPGILAA